MEVDIVHSLQLPPGFRFNPSDEELIVHYLQNKVNSCPLPACVIAEVELYKYDPWELHKKALFGEDEWYFFSPRDRKYPKGVRPNRAAGSGYWKATGIDKPIFCSSGSRRIGLKKALVFYSGRPRKAVKTDWIMHEYRLPNTVTTQPLRSKGSMRLDDWVLCRVRKKGNMSKNENSPGKLPRYQSMNEQLPSVHTGDTTNTTNYYSIPKDCPVLASLLAGQDLSIETISDTTFQGSSNINDSGAGYEHVSGQGSTRVTNFFSAGNFFDSSKQKLNETNMYEDHLQSIEMEFNGQKNDNILLSNMPMANANYVVNQFQGEIFKPNPSNAPIISQELKMAASSENFPEK